MPSKFSFGAVERYLQFLARKFPDEESKLLRRLAIVAVALAKRLEDIIILIDYRCVKDRKWKC